MLIKGGVITKNFENQLSRNIHVIYNHFGAIPPTRPQGIIIVIKRALTTTALTLLRNMCTVPIFEVLI